MGPAIVFDKSALQSMSRAALREANRYFYTVIPDVLLHEILADLTLDRKNVDPQERVAMLANKISFHHACASMHFRKLCIQDLLGNYIPMDRRPVVDAATGQRLTTEDGQVGFVRDVQSENEAVLRWGSSVFNREDFDFATKWRSDLSDFDSESSTELRNMRIGVSSFDDVNEHVKTMLRDPESHLPMINTYMGFLACGEKTCNRVLFRWQTELPARQSLPAFAPYATYCLRVYLFYYCAASHGLLPTKPNTIIDLEYFYHTPFTQVFCSSDKLHKKMAPFVLGDDQSFVDGEELRAELDALAKGRETNSDATPREDSLIHRLWVKHLNRLPDLNRKLSNEELERISEECKPILQAIQQATRQEPSERFPKTS